MSSDAAPRSKPFSPLGQLRYAREILKLESEAVAEVAKRLGFSFCRAADRLYHSRGSVIVTGMDKAGQIGHKISATLASTGTRSHWVHPAEALHGDLGRIHPQGTVLIRLQSGETDEVVRLLPWLRELGVPLIALTAESGSSLASGDYPGGRNAHQCSDNHGPTQDQRIAGGR
jgi:arabinose-5-phosphate isomerase